jgi:hypothetical protein
MIVPFLTQLQRMKRLSVSSMIPKQNDNSWNGACVSLQNTIIFYFKSKKKQRGVGHTFDSQGIDHKELIPPGQPVNKE